MRGEDSEQLLNWPPISHERHRTSHIGLILCLRVDADVPEEGRRQVIRREAFADRRRDDVIGFSDCLADLNISPCHQWKVLDIMT